MVEMDTTPFDDTLTAQTVGADPPEGSKEKHVILFWAENHQERRENPIDVSKVDCEHQSRTVEQGGRCK